MDIRAPVHLLNGQPADADGAGLRALALSNYGHFTSLQVRAGCAQGIGLHMERLRLGNVELFDEGLDETSVRAWMAHASASGDCSLRVTVFARGFDHRQPLRRLATDVLVSATAPAAVPARPLRVQVRHFFRPVPQLKHVGTFPLFHHRRQAQMAGFDDALFVDGGQARISEGTVWNIGFWDGARVIWPQAPALRGTAERMLQLGLAAHGVAQEVRPVGVDELPSFRAAFTCNATGVQPIIAIDDLDYDDAPDLHAVLAAAATHAPWEPLSL